MVYRLDTPGVEDLAIKNEKIGSGAVSTAKADSSINNALVPINGIIMYSGTQASIPANWALCDGNNGTPNLVNKFIIAAASYDTTVTPSGNDSGWRTAVEGTDEASGGEATKLLGTANLPSHTHTITDQSHRHAYAYASRENVNAGIGNDYQGSDISNVTDHGKISELEQSGTPSDPDLHGFTADTESVSTGITQTNDQGGTMGESFDILPPYYAIAYIMRVS